ncbi:hypothetical protein FRAHR75_320066 [Frankia sp. Hr75.2]|nr:hypothetical protein FRAHR75_320066 [Frankia sp. Hr75.2]
MPRYKRIRVRGRPRVSIDVDLLAQALIMASEDIQGTAQPEAADAIRPGTAGEEVPRTTARPDDYPDF